MKPVWDQLITQLREAIKKWDTASPPLPQPIPVQNSNQGADKDDISKTLTSCLYKMMDLDRRTDIDSVLLAVLHHTLQTQLNTLTNSLNGNLATPQGGYALVSALWHCRNTLIWFAPPATDVIESLVARDDLKEKGKRILVAADTIQHAERGSREAASRAANHEKETSAIRDKIMGYEREAANAKTNAEANASASEIHKVEIETLVSSLADAEQRQGALLQEIQALRQKAAEALEAASRRGLAQSFFERAEKLTKTRRAWAFGFFFGLAFMAIIEFLAVRSFKSYPVLVGHALLGAPFVWWTWFAARQYGQTAKIQEDYAFKNAAALAFNGYRREVSDDEEMVKLLRQVSISAFGENPARMFAKSDPGSPTHDLAVNLTQKLAKMSPKELVDLLTSALAQKGKGA